MKEVFTLRRSYLRIGILCSLGFSAWLTIIIVMMFASDDLFPAHRATYGKIVFGVIVIAIPSFFLAMSIWLIIAYCRQSITLENGRAHFAGVLVGRTLGPEGMRACWRWGQHTSLKLFSPSGNVTIWLESFPGNQQEKLIRFFREWIPPNMQDGWCQDFECYAAEIEAKESPAEIDREFRRSIKELWRATAMAAPFVLVVCAGVFAVTIWYANSTRIADISSWTGFVMLGCAVLGAVSLGAVPLLFSCLLLMCRWMNR